MEPVFCCGKVPNLFSKATAQFPPYWLECKTCGRKTDFYVLNKYADNRAKIASLIPYWNELFK